MGSVAQPSYKQSKEYDNMRSGARRRRYRLQAEAARLLPGQRVGGCMCKLVDGGGSVSIHRGESGAFFRGLQTCGSVWTCPVCAHKISQARRDELNRALKMARDVGWVPVMLSLTVRHSVTESLKGNLDVIRAAKKRLHESRSWRELRKVLIGQVTALEVTHGESGWHPHFHVLLFLCPVKGLDLLAMVERCRAAWENGLLKSGGDCNQHGFQVQGADKVGDYVTKWGAGDEMVLSGSKRGGAGRSPWELLGDSADGDKAAGALFAEFAGVFKGQRQLIWSRGFKDLVGVEDFDDVELAEAQEPAEYICTLTYTAWREVLRQDLRAEILDLAERYGALGVVAFVTGLEGCTSNDVDIG